MDNNIVQTYCIVLCSCILYSSIVFIIHLCMHHLCMWAIPSYVIPRFRKFCLKSAPPQEEYLITQHTCDLTSGPPCHCICVPKLRLRTCFYIHSPKQRESYQLVCIPVFETELLASSQPHPYNNVTSVSVHCPVPTITSNAHAETTYSILANFIGPLFIPIREKTDGFNAIIALLASIYQAITIGGKLAQRFASKPH